MSKLSRNFLLNQLRERIGMSNIKNIQFLKIFFLLINQINKI